MMACILAGGEGTRLRPLTAFTPKPMVELGEKPVLGHILSRLKSFGITRAVVTLMYLPDAVKQGIGDGEDYGVEITYRVEDRPLGTAGAVRACADLFRGEGEILVLSGDGITGFDFAAALDFHKRHRAEATLLTSRVTEPTEYGLVRTGEDGKILGFAEKPGWDGVFTDRVNTGVYILTPAAIEKIPENRKYDFSGDLFPRLLSEGGLYAYPAEGYWCDIGDPGAYLKCHMDYLDGRIGALPQGREISQGVWAAENAEIAGDARILPPVLICDGVQICSGAVVGPGVVLGAGAGVGENASVIGSAVYGQLGEGAEVEDAIICRGAKVGACSAVRRGSIVGPGAVTGDHSFVPSGGVVGENESLPGGAILGAGRCQSGLSTENGAILLAPERVFGLGAACTGLGKRILIGSDGGEKSKALEEGLLAGLVWGGAEVLRHDGDFAAAAAELAISLKADLSLFVSGKKLKIYSAVGQPLDDRAFKKLSQLTLRGTVEGKSGSVTDIRGAFELLAAGAANFAKRKASVFVAGTDGAAQVMKKALSLSGFRLENSEEAIMLAPTADGFGFKLLNKSEFSCEHTLGLGLLALAAGRPGAKIAIPRDAPAAFSLAVNRHGSAAVRLGRDSDAEKLAAGQKVGFFAAHTAVALTGYLDSAGLSPETLFARLPAYSVARAEVKCETPKAELMGRLMGSFSRVESDGVTVSTNRGSARLRPSAISQTILVTAEAANAETAAAIAEDIAALAKKLDIKS